MKTFFTNKILQKSLLFIFSMLLLTACSTKEVYEPKKVEADWEKYEDTKHTIIDTAQNIALFDDGDVLVKDGVLKLNIDSTKRVISSNDDWIISASMDGNLTLTSKKKALKSFNFDLKKSVASASVENDFLAVVFSNNEIALYDINSKELLFKEQEGKSIALDSRIVNPYFMRGLVLYPTLDGKIIFVNTQLRKRLRTVIVSSEENFNNIISLHVIENKIIAATSYKILSMAKKEVRVKYELRNIIYDDKDIYIATKQGEILSLTSSLEINSKIKLPFAHFYAMTMVDDKLYILEKEGYMIVVDKNSFEYRVHEVDFNDEGYIFVAGKEFYIDDKKILTR